MADVLVASPPITTPFLEAGGRITAPWVSWLQSISRVLGITNTVAGTGLQSTNNLSDLASKPQARLNLGLGSAALHPATDFDVSGAAAALAATLAPSATIDTTNASNISSGTLATARLPVVPIANGGTGSATAAAALTALGAASVVSATLQTFAAGVSAVGLKSTGGLILTRISKAVAYTLTAADYAISADATTAGFTLSLLATPTDGQYYEVTKIDATANIVTIAGNGHNINGAATKTLTTQWATARLQYDATLGQWIAK